ncbi:MAG: single-stranded-DNA-specific exonuclease RecJ [Lentihominibacter sp.]
MRNSEEIIREILKKRGLADEEDIKEYLSPRPQRTYDPFLLDDMKAGVDLMLSEIEKGSRICIYGDYDADGVTATTVMSRGISELTDNWFYYIPSRFTEGYGLNRGAIDKIKDAGADLIITVDCGCVSYREVEYAKAAGLKVIVTDHHTIEDTIADCIVIDPKKPEKFLKDRSRRYPFSDLAGCGVAFKFVQALQRQAGLSKNMVNDCLDMVAIGTVGDIVSLRDENRTLVKYGVEIANSGRRKSLSKLMNAISLDEINSENIAFGIVPHINATGRMDSAAEAVELFISGSDAVIDEKVAKLISCNRERKRIQEEAYERCLNLVTGEERFIVLRVTDMHEGIAGIVAGKLKDRFNRSVIIVTPTGDGFLKGTGRSIPAIDIYDILNCHSSLFERFGGHRSAAGFLMKEENFNALVEGIDSCMDTLLEENDRIFECSLEVDSTLTPAEATCRLAREIQALAPFGEGNPNPRFVMKNVRISGLSFMGDNDIHARFYAGDGENSRKQQVNCVLFRNARENREALESGKPLSLYGSLNYQIWRGQERVQFIVEEIL